MKREETEQPKKRPETRNEKREDTQTIHRDCNLPNRFIVSNSIVSVFSVCPVACRFYLFCLFCLFRYRWRGSDTAARRAEWLVAQTRANDRIVQQTAANAKLRDEWQRVCGDLHSEINRNSELSEAYLRTVRERDAEKLAHATTKEAMAQLRYHAEALGLRMTEVRQEDAIAISKLCGDIETVEAENAYRMKERDDVEAELDAERVRCESEAARVGELNTTVVGLGEEVRRCVEERDSVQAALEAERGRCEAEAARAGELSSTMVEMGEQVARCSKERDEVQVALGAERHRSSVTAVRVTELHSVMAEMAEKADRYAEEERKRKEGREEEGRKKGRIKHHILEGSCG